MAVETLVPVEEYLATSYDPDVEYVDGQLVERNVGEHDHSQLQIILGSLLRSRQAERRFRTFPEQRVRVSASRFRIPDVCVMALPYRREPVLTQPPHLVVEIRSPDDRWPDILAKVADYLAFGIPHVWLIDPYKRTVHEFAPDLARQADDLTLETELVGRVEFAPLFAELDEPTEYRLTVSAGTATTSPIPPPGGSAGRSPAGRTPRTRRTTHRRWPGAWGS